MYDTTIAAKLLGQLKAFLGSLLCQSERNFRFCLVGQRERLKG